MTATRYIIMADGKMTRWKNFLVPKHMLPVHGEPILLRTVRLVRRFDPNAEIIITSDNPSYEGPGTVRYEPQNNHCEIDRFTGELIGDGVCFLYGDVYYTDQAIEKIAAMSAEALGFAGNGTEIFAVKVGDGEYQKACIRKLKEAGGQGRGMQLYELAAGDGKAVFCPIADDTTGFNTEEEYHAFARRIDPDAKL